MSEDFTIQINMAGWDAWQRDLEAAPTSLEKHMKNAMGGTLQLLLDWIAAETPVNYGLLRGSWTTEATGSAANLRGEVSTDLIYGWIVERGRMPGRMPPVDAIALWAKRKLGLQGDELEAAAWAIARAIGKRGTSGAAMVWKAYQRAATGNEVSRIWEYELDAFLQELAG